MNPRQNNPYQIQQKTTNLNTSQDYNSQVPSFKNQIYQQQNQNYHSMNQTQSMAYNSQMMMNPVSNTQQQYGYPQRVNNQQKFYKSVQDQHQNIYNQYQANNPSKKKPWAKGNSNPSLYSSYYSYVSRLDWMRAEELALNQGQLNILLKILVKQRMVNEALSIIKRSKTNINTLPFQLKNSINQFQDNFTYVDNTVISKDYFGPTSVIADKEIDKESFLNLKELSYDENDIVIIDDDNTPLFDQSVNKIMASKIVGIDCEFVICFNSEQKNTVSLIQIADNETCIIFDCTKLLGSQKMQMFLQHFISNPEILKIGHSFFGDLKVLETTFSTKFVRFLFNPIN